jgi:hypothetical protein
VKQAQNNDVACRGISCSADSNCIAGVN